ncbi:hypothetical protein [Olleya sp. YS]|uniref:hypothetical protein n=1 Tax=Olleya sp. YS TaxID=3028318 RepID=UPI0024341656|nr:hypothetical protein [Olleya sp. YS]WGD35821.1 hypothetical protein Ollyesu_05255 [Olleya sp. YS]
MLTEQELLEIANKYISYKNEKSEIEFMILDEFTLKKSYGYIFFYTSKKYYETKDFKYAIAGNGPFLVENKEGLVYKFGTARDTEYYIKEYEAGTWVPASDGIWRSDNEQ